MGVENGQGFMPVADIEEALPTGTKNYLPVKILNKGSGSGGVETVTGTAVDNTDPLNPVIDSEGFSYTFEYTNNSPVETDDQDTGINPATLPDNSIVLITVLFTVNSNSNQYAIAISTDNQLAQLQPDIRQLRSAEPVTGGGDIAIASWVDGTTGTYHYSLDVDGGGKTLDSVSLAVRTLS